jgi:hypothetical protein
MSLFNMFLKSAKEEKDDGSQDCIADNIKFETEDAALAYAKRLVTLTPGTVVATKVEGRELMRGVFFGPTDNGRRAMIAYYSDEYEFLASQSVPWGNIRILEEA